MKSPLSYQATMFDCGKTSFVDALMYLFEREEIPPQVIDYVTRVTGDCNIGVNGYMRGTSGRALAFMADWCNDYLVKAGLPIRCQALAAVCGCNINVDHYVVMTGLDGDDVLVFDPFYEPWPPQLCTLPESGVEWVFDQPFSHNRRVSRAVLNNPDAPSYSLYATCGRDAVLLWRTDGVDAEG